MAADVVDGISDDESGSETPPAADWYGDPLGRHQYRYWDGTAWTQNVADDGRASVDPPEEHGTPKAEADDAAQPQTGPSAVHVEPACPDVDTLEDLLPAVLQWMGSDAPAADRTKLVAFFDDIASNWRSQTSWRSGSAAEVYEWFQKCATEDARSQAHGSEIEVLWGRDGDRANDFWARFGVLGSVIEPEVHGLLHFIGKAPEGEFLYLAHKSR